MVQPAEADGKEPHLLFSPNFEEPSRRKLNIRLYLCQTHSSHARKLIKVLSFLYEPILAT